MKVKAKDRIKSLRLGNGMSQSELAEASGVNVRMVQNYEQGNNDINMAQAITVWKLARALHCRMEDILDLPEE